MPGLQGGANTNHCVKCPWGSIASFKGVTQCFACPDDTVSDMNRVKCLDGAKHGTPGAYVCLNIAVGLAGLIPCCLRGNV